MELWDGAGPGMVTYKRRAGRSDEPSVHSKFSEGKQKGCACSRAVREACSGNSLMHLGRIFSC